MLKPSFSPFPVLNTERLTLRRITEADVQEVFDLRDDAKTLQYARMHIRKVNEALEKNQSINWAITLKGETRLIGIIGFVRIQPKNYRAEIGYILHPEYHQQGIMHEAMTALLDYGFFTLQFNSIIAVIDPANEASEKLLLSHRFEKEAHLKENMFVQGNFKDTFVYSLLKRNYIASHES